MARIEGVSTSQAGPIVKLVYRFGPRMMKKMTGRDPQTGSGIEPIEIWALPAEDDGGHGPVQPGGPQGQDRG